MERRQALSAEIHGILNDPPAVDSAINSIVTAIKRETGFDAVGIRLHRGDDFPYFAQDGFSKEFLLAENTVAVRDQYGGVCLDKNGNISLECTCGLVISGHTDPTNTSFTPRGSFWTNESDALLALPIESDPRLHPRNRCIHEGFHSVALIPLKAGEQIIGLLQLNDRRPNRVTPELVSFFEDLCASIGISLARKQAESEMKTARTRSDTLNLDLEAVNEELEAFSYSVSHDLRAPLRHMAGFARLLQKRTEGQIDEQALHYTVSICDAAKKMDLMIDDLLSFSQLGRKEIQRSKVSLNALVSGVVREIQEGLEERKISWEIDELPDVYGDQSLLRLVLSNLVSNAVKYTGRLPHAEIKIGYKEDRDETIIFVKDNGAGFDMKYKDKLFGGFQRLHTQNEFEGTGIGLANVRRIISRHGGRTWAEGFVGQGATFYFTIPRRKELIK